MNSEFVGLALIVITVIISYKGFSDQAFFNAYAFNVGGILGRKEYKRMISSGFLHGSWMHLGFNMLSLYSFIGTLTYGIGTVRFLIIYFGSLIGGNLLSLFMHRHNSNYTAIGASGAVCGVLFAAIAYDPSLSLSMMFIPIGIPGWLFALIFIGITIFGIRSQAGNIGHEAHLGGALVGQLIFIAFVPESLRYNTLPIVLTMVPSVIFLFLVARRPAFLVTGSFTNTRFGETKDDRYNAERKQRQAEVDKLLEKIHSSGFDSLTPQERDRLDKLTR
jgi:membrane associated rhomboid family serine protease